MWQKVYEVSYCTVCIAKNSLRIRCKRQPGACHIHMERKHSCMCFPWIKKKNTTVWFLSLAVMGWLAGCYPNRAPPPPTYRRVGSVPSILWYKLRKLFFISFYMAENFAFSFSIGRKLWKHTDWTPTVHTPVYCIRSRMNFLYYRTFTLYLRNL